LHQRVVAIDKDQGEPTVAYDYVALRGRGAADNGAGCVGAAGPHLHGRAATHHGRTIGIHTEEIACYKIIVAAHEDQRLTCVIGTREAESPDRRTGTIARQSASCGRTKLYHAIVSGIAEDLDQDDGVISGRERVRASARLGVAIDDHRLTESETEARR
jgi:hypothetical protein